MTQDQGITRRRLLAGAGAVAGGMLARPLAPAWGAGDGGELEFAVIADTHMIPQTPSHSDSLSEVFRHIAARPAPPVFTLHVGDVVESGLPGEYEEWDRLAVNAPPAPLHAVKGNHEIRWDERAAEPFEARFRRAPYSFDAGPLHVVGLDPTQLLQEPGYFGADQLRWLTRDLRRAGERPVVAFQHYPVGGDNHYVGNQDELLAILTEFRVPVVFAGHIHRLEVNRQDGVAMVALPGILNGPAYHWVRAAGRTLTVTQAERTVAGWSERTVAEVELRAPRRRAPEAVRSVELDAAADRSVVGVAVALGSAAQPASVRARVWPERTWAGADGTGWVELVRDPGGDARWTGSLDVSALAAGTYRVQARAVSATGALFDSVERLALPRLAGERLREVASRDLGSSVQADLTAVDAGVVAATLGGRVHRLAFAGRHAHERWSADLGAAVCGAPLVSPDGSLVVVASANRRVTALDARRGRVRWRAETAGPALAGPAWTGGSTVLVGAERTLYALDAATGSTLWTADAGGFIGGRPAADGDAVYLGAGDGKAHAFDLHTGAQRWERLVSTRTTNPYQTLIYGPWAARVVLVTGGRAILSTVSNTHALDRATGAEKWRLAGSTLYAAALPLPGGDRLVLVEESGRVRAVDAATGSVAWTAQLTQRVQGGSPVLWQGLVAIAGVNGLVALIDPATGAVVERLHPTVDYQYGAPAAAGEALAVGGQDGCVRFLVRT